MKILIHPWFYASLILGGLVSVAAPTLHWSPVIVWPISVIAALLPMIAATSPHTFDDWAIPVPDELVREGVLIFGGIGTALTLLAKLLPTSPYAYSWVLPAALTVTCAMVTAIANQLRSDEVSSGTPSPVPALVPVPAPAPPAPTTT